MNGHVIPLQDKKIGKLRVLKYVGIGKDKYARWLCTCDCGKNVIVRGISLKRGHTKSCGCSWHPQGPRSKLWKGHGEISGLYWRNVIASAKQRKILFSLDIKDMWDLFLRQGRCCAITKLPLRFAQTKQDYLNCSASLDRIDSTQAYVTNNVRWVHKIVNQIKWELSDEELKKWCRLILGI